MSSPSDPTNPNDLAYYAPPGLREKARSASLSRETTSEPAAVPVSQRPSLEVPLKRPIYLRQPPVPEAVYENAGIERERPRLFGAAGRFAAAAAFVAIAALFFILVLPALRQSEASSTAPEITGSIQTALPQVSQKENGSKPALSDFEGFLAKVPDGKSADKEPSPELLTRFLQWRQKADPQ